MLTMEQAEELQRTLQDRLIPEKAARAQGNRFVLEHLRDGFCAGQPRFVLVGSEPVWSVPIVVANSTRVLEQAGEVLIHAVHGSVIGFTPPTEIYRNARQLTV